MEFSEGPRTELARFVGPPSISKPDSQTRAREDTSRWTHPVGKLRELRRKLKSTEQTLDRHQYEWVDLQIKIFCLGAHVLGPGHISSPEVNVHGLFQKKLEQAIERYQGQANMDEEFRKAAQKERVDILAITMDSLKEMSVHERVRCISILSPTPAAPLLTLCNYLIKTEMERRHKATERRCLQAGAEDYHRRLIGNLLLIYLHSYT